jgi:XTP/dITP diphosphohydrolase
MKLLIATSNPGKLEEIKRFLSDISINIVGLSDMCILAEAPEIGNSFKEIAISKAKYYQAKSGLPTIADDGGLEIDALNGEPGVKSHRWVNSHYESKDEELISFTLSKMNNIPLNNRGAQLRTVVAFITSSGKIVTRESFVRGIIAKHPSSHRTIGFPYRSLLFLPEIGKFYDQTLLTKAENEQYNHRGKAIKELIPIIKQELGV